MKPNRQTNPKKPPLSSKLRDFWILHPDVLIVIVCAVFIVIAIAILYIVGTYRHWEISVMLTSPRAILVYVIAGFIAVLFVFQRIIFRRW